MKNRKFLAVILGITLVFALTLTGCPIEGDPVGPNDFVAVTSLDQLDGTWTFKGPIDLEGLVGLFGGDLEDIIGNDPEMEEMLAVIGDYVSVNADISITADTDALEIKFDVGVTIKVNDSDLLDLIGEALEDPDFADALDELEDMGLTVNFDLNKNAGTISFSVSGSINLVDVLELDPEDLEYMDEFMGEFLAESGIMISGNGKQLSFFGLEDLFALKKK